MVALERSGAPVPADYLEGYDVWRRHKGGVFDVELAGLIDSMESRIPAQ